MKKINVPFEVKDLGTKFLTSDIWFVCSDLKYKKCLRPKRYKNINQGNSLKIIESEIREYFPNHEKDTSFVRASFFNATNTHRPDQILEREEYTYYFKLLPQEIEKCLFSLTLNGEIIFSKGIQGFINTYKLWYEDESKENIKIFDRPVNNIEVFIPFKIKPQYYIPEINKRIFYHGSQKRFNMLKKYSYVTPYKEDAIKFAIPWDSKDLLYNDYEMSDLGRPPVLLRFKRNISIEDTKIFLYSIKGIKTIQSKSNTGKIYPWNRITIENSYEKEKSLKLERKIMSWKEELYFN